MERFKEEWKEIRKLSELSLIAPLSDRQFKRMKELADMVNLKGGEIPRL